FYIFWGIGAFVLLRFASLRVTAIVLGVSAMLIYAWRWYLLLTGAEPMRIYVGFDTRADELLIGCLGALLLPASLRRTRYGGLAALVALIAIAFCAKAYYVSPTVELMDFAVLMTAVALLTMVLILDLATNACGPLSQALSFRPLVYIGSISYG